MPVHPRGRGCFQWGRHGKVYCGPGARGKAERQGRAAFAGGYRGRETSDADVWYRGGGVKHGLAWYVKSERVAAFYGEPVVRCTVAGELLDLTAMGVDVDDRVVPVQVDTSSGEAYEWAQEAWQLLRDLGYDGVVVKQWHYEYSPQTYTALLYWGAVEADCAPTDDAFAAGYRGREVEEARPTFDVWWRERDRWTLYASGLSRARADALARRVKYELAPRWGLPNVPTRVVPHGEAIENALEETAALGDLTALVEAMDARYPLAGDVVDGRKVHRHVPNLGSSDGYLRESEPLAGVRTVAMSDFGGPRSVFYAADDFSRSERLAAAIRQSGEISPLIVGVDAQGPFLIEGAHRFVALWYLQAAEFPAVVVVGED